MTQADSVLSTPPTNTPKIPPVDQARRHFLTVAVGGAAATLAIPATAEATGSPVDPIYAAIEQHKAACVPWDTAISVRGSYDESDDNETQRLDDAQDEAWEAVEQAGIDLITTGLTTPAGIITAVRYIQIQMRDDGTYMPQGIEFEYSDGSAGDSRAAMGWIEAFLDTIADAATKLDQPGKAVQS